MLKKQEVKQIELNKLTEGPRETDPYSCGVTQALAGDSIESKATFYTLEDDDIRLLQKEVDKKSQIYIKLAQEQGLISQEDVDGLLPYYTDTMTLYGKFYDILVEALGNPQSCHRNDLDEGEKDDKNYTQTYITPSNSMILSYTNILQDPDIENNNIYVSLPGMKSIVRAIEKIKKGGKYDQAYRQELQSLSAKYPQGGEAYQKERAKIQPPIKRLKDILRATISVPTYDSIDKIIERITQDHNFVITETKDKFNANLSARDRNFYDNKKNYRDKKLCFNKNGYDFEIQFKVQHLERADRLSHAFYEKLRQKIDEYAEIQTDNIDAARKKRQEIIWLERDIQRINRKGIDAYNIFILETAQKKDIRIKKAQIRSLRQRYAESKSLEEKNKLQKEIYFLSQTLHAAPISEEAKQFICNNFMVRPYKAINQKSEYADLSPELQSFAMLNYLLVSKRYRGTIRGDRRFNNEREYLQAEEERRRQDNFLQEQEYKEYMKAHRLKQIILSRKNYYGN